MPQTLQHSFEESRFAFDPPPPSSPPSPPPVSPTKNEPLTVSALTEQIKRQLERSYADVHVEGEVSNFKLHSSGHWYFTLKDRDAQISVALFKSSAQKIKMVPKDGDQVQVRGKISLFAPRGQYQLVATSLEKKGLGELLVALEKLKLELKNRGWFDREHKKPLPPLPKIIGVVTSPTGAAIQDMIHVLRHRTGGFHLRLFPVHVQGEGAAAEIAEAISAFNRFELCDVLIIGRGGGSYEDLMAFNDYGVLCAIHESKIPVISAVGHETDFTLSDFVADHRAPTPSAAAERVMASRSEREERLTHLRSHLSQRLSHLLSLKEARLDKAKHHSFLRDPLQLLNTHWQRLDFAQESLERRLDSFLQLAKSRLSSASLRLQALDPRQLLLRKQQLFALYARQLLARGAHLLESPKARFERARARLQALSPTQILQRGYTMTTDAQSGAPLTKLTQLTPHQKVHLHFVDGEASAQIQSMHMKRGAD